jgi:hypothetical protein
MKYYVVYRQFLSGSEQKIATVWASSCNAACARVRDEQQLNDKAKLYTIDYDKRNQIGVCAEYPDVNHI